MRSSFAATLAFWQVLAGTAVGKPVLPVNRRTAEALALPVAQPTPGPILPPDNHAGALYPRQASTTTSASAGAAAPAPSVTVTLYQNAENAYDASPATTTPSSGCVVATQQQTTDTWLLTFDLVTTTSIETNLITLTSGLYCECGATVVTGSTHGGLIAGLGTSYNTAGTQFLYCETGGAVSPVTTASPTPSPGSADNPDVSLNLPALSAPCPI